MKEFSWAFSKECLDKLQIFGVHPLEEPAKELLEIPYNEFVEKRLKERRSFERTLGGFFFEEILLGYL